MQFRAPPPPQVSRVRPAQSPSPSDRDCPLHTAGDRCLWHVGGTAGEHEDARTWRRRLRAEPEGEDRPAGPCFVSKLRTRRGGPLASLQTVGTKLPGGSHKMPAYLLAPRSRDCGALEKTHLSTGSLKE
jgi:hypothetical protein